ncbi:hypothetical protein GCM10010104_23670 [Streptomyces indiaensis]|uniref:Uncharacterized protein n=1 Tax=Streptomyces indiaensis TaxID=284033 RepID=A0ABN3DFK3_9ACTN
MFRGADGLEWSGRELAAVGLCGAVAGCLGMWSGGVDRAQQDGGVEAPAWAACRVMCPPPDWVSCSTMRRPRPVPSWWVSEARQNRSDVAGRVAGGGAVDVVFGGEGYPGGGPVGDQGAVQTLREWMDPLWDVSTDLEADLQREVFARLA